MLLTKFDVEGTGKLVKFELNSDGEACKELVEFPNLEFENPLDFEDASELDELRDIDEFKEIVEVIVGFDVVFIDVMVAICEEGSILCED